MCVCIVCVCVCVCTYNFASFSLSSTSHTTVVSPVYVSRIFFCVIIYYNYLGYLIWSILSLYFVIFFYHVKVHSEWPFIPLGTQQETDGILEIGWVRKHLFTKACLQKCGWGIDKVTMHPGLPEIIILGYMCCLSIISSIFPRFFTF